MSATDARPSHTVHAILAVASERITSAWLSVGDPTAIVVADYGDFAVQEDGRATTALNLSLTVAPGVAAEDFAAEVLSPFPAAGWQKARGVITPFVCSISALASELEEHMKHTMAPYRYPTPRRVPGRVAEKDGVGQDRRVELREIERQRSG